MIKNEVGTKKKKFSLSYNTCCLYWHKLLKLQNTARNSSIYLEVNIEVDSLLVMF